MLLWLRRTPESFIPTIADANAEGFRLPELTMGEILRWDTPKLFFAIDAQRRARQLRWADVAAEMMDTRPECRRECPRAGGPDSPT
jgi:hypothetical protein